MSHGRGEKGREEGRERRGWMPHGRGEKEGRGEGGKGRERRRGGGEDVLWERELLLEMKTCTSMDIEVLCGQLFNRGEEERRGGDEERRRGGEVEMRRGGGEERWR